MELPMEGIAIGIDLGTSNSCVGVWHNNCIEIITNDQGSRTTPSWVAFNNKQCIVGEGAKAQAGGNPTNTIYDAKRLIGRRFADPTVQKNINSKNWPFKVIEGKGGHPLIVVNYMDEEKKFSAEQISSMVLVKMKETAEAFLGMKVRKAVITVPAYFNNAQRQATKDAGKIAELNVIRIINEPTAAAIAYGLEIRAADCNDASRNILIFDLGGGTFDVSLVVVGNDSFEVRAVSGDTHLGGMDFDSNMVGHCVAEFKRKYNKDINGEPKALGKLRAQCERAKIILSSTTDTIIEVDSLFTDIDFSYTIHRQQFERMNLSLFKSCIEPIKTCLMDAKMKKSDVDDVVLVGGSSRIPMVQKLVKEFFDGKVLCQSLNPDEAVAYGAAIHAAILSGVRHAQHKLVDVSPLSLGIEVLGGALSVVIPRNTKVPTKMKETYYTVCDNQTAVRTSVYEGERSIANDNHLLGEFVLSGIPPARAGAASVTTTFEIDVNSILTVTSEIESTGGMQNIVIAEHSGNLSNSEIDRMVNENKMHRIGVQVQQNVIKARSDVERFVTEMSEKVRSHGGLIKPEDKKKLEDAIRDTTGWLDLNVELSNAIVFKNKLVELKDICNSSILQSTSEGEGEPSNFNVPIDNPSSPPKKTNWLVRKIVDIFS